MGLLRRATALRKHIPTPGGNNVEWQRLPARTYNGVLTPPTSFGAGWTDVAGEWFLFNLWL